MTITLSAVDLFYFKQELRAKLLDAKVEQIYQHDAASITIRFYKNGIGKIDLFIAPPRGLYITTNKPASSEELFGFCGILRKYLPSTTLTAIDQVGFSRTMRFDFQYRDSKSKFALIVELYDKGNIILIDAKGKQEQKEISDTKETNEAEKKTGEKDTNDELDMLDAPRANETGDMILAPMQVQRWEHRTIAAGQPYTPVINQFPQDIVADKVAELAKSAAAESMTASKFAATKFNLGGNYGALLCAMADISPNSIISTDEAKKLGAQLQSLFTQQFSPHVALEKSARTDDVATTAAQTEHMSEIMPAEKEKKNINAKAQMTQIKAIFPFINPAALSLFGSLTPTESLSAQYEKALFLHDKPVVDKKVKASSSAQKKFQNILAAQQASIAQLEAESEANKQIGTYMYENHSYFENLLAKINELIEAQKRFQKSQTKPAKHTEMDAALLIELNTLGIISHDSAKKAVTLEIPETQKASDEQK